MALHQGTTYGINYTEALHQALAHNGDARTRSSRAMFIMRVAQALEKADRQKGAAVQPPFHYVVVALVSMGAADLARSFMHRLVHGGEQMAA